MDKLVRQTKEYAGNIVLAIGGAKCFVSNFLLNLNVRASYQLWCIKSRPSPIRGTLAVMAGRPTPTDIHFPRRHDQTQEKIKKVQRTERKFFERPSPPTTPTNFHISHFWGNTSHIVKVYLKK